MSETSTTHLSAAGVSIWLDDLSRSALTSGSLQRFIDEMNVVGVTTNPTIFAGALTDGRSYADQVAQLATAGVSADEAVFEITTDDVANACTMFRGIYDATNGVDGRVSIEVSPTLAHDAPGTIAEAKRLWAKVDRENALIKIPATLAGLDAITEVIGAGISVNVTLIFSLDRHKDVIDAYLAGLEKARTAGINLAEIHSVASFFVSRVDTEVDARLVKIGTPEALELKSKAGIANARLAYQLFENEFNTPRAVSLLASGANPQRPLWASTGVKDPSLPDTLYVTELVAAGVVNTMPEKTLRATFDHGIVTGDSITVNYGDAEAVFAALAAVGVDIDDVTAQLEREGVEKFIISWGELLDTVRIAMEGAK
ncbi:transaldolase [Alpinimonas psychrophila]|uniref:Transaldolase n=1 Tax=Alpinimonas psychrophila TaxID=748908 RepID=A0A7W3PN33_9MICO|nr:transaldolase [Alpinimonas psychrophila]MBA8828469.1 transaldolase [Alpinimonas psychrophila]